MAILHSFSWLNNIPLHGSTTFHLSICLWMDIWVVSAAAATAKSLQSCPTLCDPIEGSPPGSPSLGFSRQEHWSGLPFPSPMQESEKWSCSVASDSSRPHGLQPTRLLRPWDFPGKSTGVGCHIAFSDIEPQKTPNSQGNPENLITVLLSVLFISSAKNNNNLTGKRIF